MAEPENFRIFETLCGIRAPECDYLLYNLSRKSAAVDEEVCTFFNINMLFICISNV